MSCTHEIAKMSVSNWCRRCGALYLGAGEPREYKESDWWIPQLHQFQPAYTAAYIVTKVMEIAEGSGKHTPGSWQNEGMEHHLDHVDDHLDEVTALIETIHRDGTLADPHIREEFEHAICRLVMAYCCAEAGVIEDYGPEGVNYDHVGDSHSFKD